MDTVSFTVPWGKLRAASRFASIDETRYTICGVHVEQPSPGKILLVGTDGRRLCVIRHEPANPVPAFADFTIPTQLILDADPCRKGRTLLAAAEDIGDDEIASIAEAYTGHDIVEVTVIGSSVTISTPGSPRKFMAGVIDGKFPNWRACIPEDTTEMHQMPAFQAVFVKGIADAVADLAGEGWTEIVATSRGERKPMTFLSIKTTDFFAVLMPVRNDEMPVYRGKPAWLY